MSGKLGAVGSQRDSVQSHGQELAHPRPVLRGRGAQTGHRFAPSRSQRDGCWRGEQLVAGQAGVSFVGLQSHVLNFPSSLLPLHLTQAHHTPTNLSILFVAGLGSIHKRLSSLEGNTSCFEDGRQQPLHPRAGSKLSPLQQQPQPQGLARTREWFLLISRHIHNISGTKHRLLHEIKEQVCMHR